MILWIVSDCIMCPAQCVCGSGDSRMGRNGLVWLYDGHLCLYHIEVWLFKASNSVNQTQYVYYCG